MLIQAEHDNKEQSKNVGIGSTRSMVQAVETLPRYLTLSEPKTASGPPSEDGGIPFAGQPATMMTTIIFAGKPATGQMNASLGKALPVPQLGIVIVPDGGKKNKMNRLIAGQPATDGMPEIGKSGRAAVAYESLAEDHIPVVSLWIPRH